LAAVAELPSLPHQALISPLGYAMMESLTGVNPNNRKDKTMTPEIVTLILDAVVPLVKSFLVTWIVVTVIRTTADLLKWNRDE